MCNVTGQVAMIFIPIPQPPPPTAVGNAGRRNWELEECSREGSNHRMAHVHGVLIPAWWHSLPHQSLFQAFNSCWRFKVTTYKQMSRLYTV